jgi:hypothetical protein
MSYRNIVLRKRANFFQCFGSVPHSTESGSGSADQTESGYETRFFFKWLKDRLKREKDPCQLVSFRGIVTNTKQEEAGIYTLDKKVLLFLGPLAFRKKKGKINLIDGSGTVFEKLRHKMYIFL